MHRPNGTVTLTLAHDMGFSLNEISQAAECSAAIVEKQVTLEWTIMRAHVLWNSP
jgi:hypothetical protein